MITREQREQLEYEILSPYASKAKESRGRQREENPCTLRTDFQRDRDRIIHSKAFRRLMHKTQVFLAPEGDHFRTRLTHTLEVAQIARTIARALSLNEDLTEAIALGHDLGHTPFGHNGEKILNSIYPGGFKHNEQSLRVVDLLEEHNGEHGMNLTAEVRDGILHHNGKESPFTLEGQIVKTADRIAYINHDIDDAIRGGVITKDRLPEECVRQIGDDHSGRIEYFVKDMIRESDGKDTVRLSEAALNAMGTLRAFMFENVYLNENVKKAADLEYVDTIITSLYGYYCAHPGSLPRDLYGLIGDYTAEEMAKDYIAGMTDRYAINLYNELFMPRGW